VIYDNGNEIVQGPGWVTLRNEMIHETRLVPLDDRPRLGAALTSFMGDSRGRWAGNTLVVLVWSPAQAMECAHVETTD
jgi:hypothetical protein